MPALGATHALFSARSMSAPNRTELRRAFDHALQLAEHNQLTLRVPHQVKSMQLRRDMHYHYRPEIFLQLQGTTDFSFPRDQYTLGPGEISVIPAGVPHGEVVHPGPDQPFRNLVAGFYNNTLSLHFAHEVRPGKPDIEVIEFFDAPNLDLFLTLATAICQIPSLPGPARTPVLKGLLLTLLGLFRNIIETGTGQLNSDIGKVFRAKCLVREQFADTELSVQHIAKTLGCSADYLSHLFHVETKERLTHYIQRIRIESAVLALESSALTISEIAYVAGFADPAYFTRVFKQHKGKTPHKYREELESQRTRQEEKPKTVYFDRLDFTTGVPQQKSEAPVASVAPRPGRGKPKA
ncbi:MAG: AraC family transcriptional regulator [Opitutales bacterium]|nr:AraC family transcriptional regulator [Opitutales bacterium]